MFFPDWFKADYVPRVSAIKIDISWTQQSVNQEHVDIYSNELIVRKESKIYSQLALCLILQNFFDWILEYATIGSFRQLIQMKSRVQMPQVFFV